MDFKNLKKKNCEPKSVDPFAKSLWFPHKNPYPSVWIQKIYRLAYGFLFFVIAISEMRNPLHIPLSSFFHVSLSPISSPLTAKKNFKLLMDFSVELGKSLLVCYGSKTFSLYKSVCHALRTVFTTLQQFFAVYRYYIINVKICLEGTRNYHE